MAKKKMKVSLDLAKIKSFFVQHVEKIVFGACALGLLLLLYKAARVETYPRQAKEISDKASEKDRMLQQAVWSSDRIEKENLTLPKLDEEIAASRVAVSADDYRIAPFNEPLFETRTKRTQPDLLPPIKPEVSADLAAFVITPPTGTPDVGSIASAPPPMFGGDEGRGGKGGGAVPEPPPGVSGPMGKGGGIPGPPGGMRGGGIFGPPGGMRGGPPMLAQGGPMANPGFPVGQGQKRVAIPYAVVKMLVPVKKQREIYRNAFVRSVHEDPSKDDPSYVGFIVERQEVGVSEAEDKPAEIIRATRWGDVGQKGTVADTLAKRNQQFAGYSPEVADPNVVLPTLVHPLGPKADSGWEVAKVVHSELVPAADEMTFSVELAAAEPEPAADDAASKDADAGPDPFAQTTVAGQPNAFRPGGGFRGGAPMMGKGGGLGERSLSVVAQGGPMGGRWQGGAAMADTEYYLLRFFDFNVVPGKSYRYRVKLGLSNPNNGLDPKYLEKPELAKETVLQTDWSEQSPVVSIPRESYFLVGEATRGSDPAIELIAVRMVADQGIKAAVAKGSQYRGQIGNFRNERVDLSTDEPAFPPPALPGEPETKKPKKERDKPIDLLTDTLLVDIRGGDPLARSKEPAEALVLTPSGRLAVRSQVADAEEYKLQQRTIEERRKRKGGKDEPQQPLFAPTGPPGKGGGK